MSDLTLQLEDAKMMSVRPGFLAEVGLNPLELLARTPVVAIL